MSRLKSFFAVSITVAGYAYSEYLKKTYPPTVGSDFKSGDDYPTETWTKKFIGYTGHSNAVITAIDKSRPLYYADKHTAQRYAARYGEGCRVGHVVGDKVPGYSHHGKSGTATNLLPFGTYEPLSPQGMKDLNIDIIDPESIDANSKVGVVASYHRSKIQ